jgi:NADH-quinone oxidoreductase subunit M
MPNIPVIPFLFLVPVFGAMAIAIFPGTDRIVRWVSLAWSLLVLGLTLGLAYHFDWSSPGEPQFLTLQGDEDMWYRQLGVQLTFAADALSMWLLLLTGLLAPLGVLASWTSVKFRVKEFFVWYLLLIASLIATFTAQDAILFYIAFEFTLIPMFFMISVYGGHERQQAAKTFFLYTFAGSMIALAAILYLGYLYSTLPATLVTDPGSWNFKFSELPKVVDSLNGPTQALIFLALMLGFAVKIPLFPFHSVPPTAYPQAPTAGSVFLAALLAKMGLYGMIRLVLPLTPTAVLEYGYIVGILAVAGILYCAMICWSQRSLKKLVAYSSISHLGFCVLGLVSLNAMAMSGSAFYMINHGITIAGLFFCIGMLEERFKTDELPMLGGVAKVMPVWSFFFVFFALANVGLPGLNGFWGEFLTLAGTFQSGFFGAMRTPEVRYATSENFSHWGIGLATVATLGVILSAIYMLHMLGKVVFGPLRLPVLGAGADTATPTHGVEPAPGARLSLDQVKDLCPRELVVLIPLALACLWFGLRPTGMVNSLNESLASVRQELNMKAGAQAVIRPPSSESTAQPATRPAPKAKKPKAEKAVADKAATEKAGVEKAGAEKTGAEKAGTEKTSVEKNEATKPEARKRPAKEEAGKASSNAFLAPQESDLQKAKPAPAATAPATMPESVPAPTQAPTTQPSP